MSVKQWLGMDVLDLVVHVGVTVCVMGFVGVSDGPEELFPVLTAISFVVFGIRRHLALKRMERESLSEGAGERIAELEDRVRDLEQLHDRLLELEERQDFTERLLARQEPNQLPK